MKKLASPSKKKDVPHVICGYKVHPDAERYELIEGEAFEAFCDDIARNGQQEQAIIQKQPCGTLMLLDGRNRGLACERLGIKLKTRTLDGKINPRRAIVSANLFRRHMEPFQRAAIIVPFKKELASEAEERRLANLKNHRAAKSCRSTETPGRPRDAAAAVAGVNHTYIDLAERLHDAHPELYAGAVDGTVSFQEARNKLAKASRRRSLPKAGGKGSADCRIIIGDAIVEMDRLPVRSAKVVFADPPYNNRWKYNGDPTGDDLPIGEYLDWCQQWMASAARLLAEDGSLFVLIDDANSDHFGVILRGLGLHRRNTIVWWEHFPQNTAGNFSRAARFVHYYTKSPKGFIWHPKRIDSRRKELGDPRAHGDGKVPDNVWPITRVVGNALDRVPFDDAPPQVPDELPLRCIEAASDPGDLVVDPFNGNGTTGRAALSCGRRYIGIERSKLYAAQAEQWIKEAAPKERK